VSNTLIKKIIKEKVLPEFPGFVGPFGGAAFFAMPMNHLWRGFSFQKSSGVPMWYVWYNVLPLYMPLDGMQIGLGGRVSFDNKQFTEWFARNIDDKLERPVPATNFVDCWVLEENQMDEAVTLLISALKTAKSKYIDPFQTPLDVAKNGPEVFGAESWNRIELYAYSFIYAEEFGPALSMLDSLLRRIHEKLGFVEQKSFLQIRVERVLELLRHEPSAAKQQLVEWEQNSIRLLKLEKYVK
jgi:hypothetical protein